MPFLAEISLDSINIFRPYLQCGRKIIHTKLPNLDIFFKNSYLASDNVLSHGTDIQIDNFPLLHN